MSTKDQNELQQRDVVSCFIFSVDKATPQVALFRRSQAVRTYQHQLAPISGRIEATESPVKAAWREIQEETTLTPQSLELWRCGKAYSFDDTNVGRRWTIYPFAFRLKTDTGEKEIQIDWEHEDWRWYNPMEVLDEQFDGVPRLAESLQRVFFEIWLNEKATQALQSCLERLKTDHHSGSHELTSFALEGFRDVLLHLECDPEWWESACTVAWHIWKNGRETMGAATLNALVAILQDMKSLTNKEKNQTTRWESILSIVDRHIERRRFTPFLIKSSFVSYLRSLLSEKQPRETLKILTLSSSSTIRDSILDAFEATDIPRLELCILESRPLFEGATMASSLLTEFQAKFQSSPDRSLNLNIYTDASAAFASTGTDLVLLGADEISSSGWVSNKMGSLPAVLSAKYVNPEVKILILSGIEKVALPKMAASEEPEESDASEVISGWLSTNVKGVNTTIFHDYEAWQALLESGDNSSCTARVRNVCFEWVPANLIDGYICEDGALDCAAIHATAKQVQERAEEYF